MTNQSLTAGYMKDFQCLGSACEDTCCSGWSVDIDKRTFLKYKRVADKKRKNRLAAHVKRNKYETTFSDYATIRFGQDGFCPFLNREKLCSIQLEMGESYLSKTCASYPRLQNRLFDQNELSGAISCPEIARLALLNPAGISFEASEQKQGDQMLDKLFDDERFLPYFADLRAFIIDLLQDRSLLLQDRLLQLGFFLQRLSELVEQESFAQIPQLLKQRHIPDEPLPEADQGFQLEILRALIDDYIERNANNKRYFECYQQMVEAVGFSAERYRLAYRQHYLPFMQEHGYIMENYLVNYVFTKLFPFFSNRTIFDDYIVMVLHYALINMHLIGLAAYHQGLTVDLAITLIQSFARTYEHDTTYFSKALDMLDDAQQNTLAAMAILIKQE